MKEQQQLKHRIKAIENTRTITGAMQMVASSKLKKAQTMLENAALYQDKLGALLGRLAQSGLEHPYLQQRRQGKRVAYVVIGATSGLSGPYNGNLNRFARQVVENSPLSCEVWTVGSRPRDFFLQMGQLPVREFAGFKDVPSFAETLPISQALAADFSAGRYDAVYLLYAHFRNVLSHHFVKTRLLPVEQPPAREGLHFDYLFEPSQEDVLAEVLRQYVELRLFVAVLSALASEFGARTTAMKAATDNADTLLSKLTLQLNHARQAAITTEVSEISGGSI